MKKFGKILSGLIVAAAAAAMFSCKNDTEEDANLVVSFSAETKEGAKEITMSAPASYEDYEIYIAYTIDGTEPDVKFDSAACEEAGLSPITKAKLKEHFSTIFDYGTAMIYNVSKKPTFESPVVIKARAFYFNHLDQNVVKGAECQTYNVEFESTASTNADDANNAVGPLTFKLSKSGNSNSTYYYDTSDKPFTYNGNEHCYYQIQFSYKANGRGNWYLFIRQLNSAKVIKSSENNVKSYVANGTYSSKAFDNPYNLTSDYLTFYREGNTNVWKGGSDTIGISSGSDSSFELTVADGKANLVEDATGN